MPPTGEPGRPAAAGDDDDANFACPYCAGHDVDRLYLASLRIDSCACLGCGARWDEDADSGAFRGRAAPSSVLAPRQR